MQKNELIKEVSKITNFTIKDTGEILNTLFNVIKCTTEGGEKVQIKDFGVFEVRSSKERVGKNPQNRETIIIPAKNALKFKACKALRDM